MNPSQSSIRRTELAEGLSPVALLVPPAAVTAMMWITSVNPVQLIGVICAHIILQLAWGSFLLWRSDDRGGFPVFSMLASIYWIYFAFVFFWGDRILFVTRGIPIPEEIITETLEMALLGVVFLLVGMKLPLDVPQLESIPDIDERANSTWLYLRVLMVGGAFFGLFPWSTFLLGSDGRQIMIIATTTVPAVAFALILRRYWMGQASPVDRVLLLVTAAVRVGGALASGWLSPVTTLGMTVVTLYIIIRRRIPWTPLVLTIVSILFLQAGKEAFRDTFWTPEIQSADASRSNAGERVGFWLETSATRWLDAFQPGGENQSSELAVRTMARASLLTQVAHVLDVMPSQIPFQQGQTYSYLAVTLIPRIIWPSKPSASDANRFYQLAFGLSDMRTVNTTSIAVGSMAEGYINFGWPGVVIIMCGIGLILRVYEHSLVNSRSNTLLLAIGVALIPHFVGIEGQLAMYVGGLLQQVVLAFLVLLPVTRKRVRVALRSNPVAPAIRVRG